MAKASKAQIKANRANAKRSTGPKSTEGKLKVSQNAITYGIFSSSPLLPSENIEEFEALKRDYAEIYPATDAVAAELVEGIILATLRRKRLRVAELAKLQISMTPEIMAEEISDILRLPFNKRLNAESISKSQEDLYQHGCAIIKEMEKINFSSKTINPGELSIHAPHSYRELKNNAKNDTLSYDKFLNTPQKIIASLESTKKYAEDFVRENGIKHTAYVIAQQMQLAKSVPDIQSIALLSKYQVQLDNDLDRAIERYKKHVAWRLESLELEVKDSEAVIGIADTEAIAA